jgi:NADH dehydrogenase [ubiquinone] 1 alpha subcomplex assembly factor 1
MHFFLGFFFFIMNSIVLVDFNLDGKYDDWKVVDDVVMGGRSDSDFTIDSQGNGIFSGIVSLENNGGFCSVQHTMKSLTLADKKYFSIRLQGDGKKYQFRVKHYRNDRHSFIYEFQTSTNWETITIPIAEMYASFRGYKVNIPNYDGSKIEQLSFLIANAKSERFELKIDKIEVK